MTSSARKTSGFGIVKIFLLNSSYKLGDGVAPIEGRPHNVDINVNSGVQEFGSQDGKDRFTVSYTVVASSLTVTSQSDTEAGDAVAWEIRSTYAGYFTHVKDTSDITGKAAREVYAPTYLYGYAREHISDIARRAGMDLVLPPLFISSEDQAEVDEPAE